MSRGRDVSYAVSRHWFAHLIWVCDLVRTSWLRVSGEFSSVLRLLHTVMTKVHAAD